MKTFTIPRDVTPQKGGSDDTPSSPNGEEVWVDNKGVYWYREEQFEDAPSYYWDGGEWLPF